jgi:hypothetical protein
MKLYRLVFVMFFVQKILKKELYEWFWESFFFFFFVNCINLVSLLVECHKLFSHCNNLLQTPLKKKA